MDREQEELQFLGFFGICFESIKIISSCRKIFLKITLSLILPLSLIFLSNIGLSTLLSWKIDLNERTLDSTRHGTTAYNKISDALSSEWTEYLLIKVLYLVFVLVFSLLSTSAVVYTTACTYSGKQITYKRVLSVVPKVWKRLVITFLRSFSALILYNVMFAFVTIFITVLILILREGREYTVPRAIMIVLSVFYLVGFVYISVIWQMASVVSVLEERYGFKAMAKSKELVKGKIGISVTMFVVVNVCLACIQIMFEKYVVGGKSIGIVGRVGFGGLIVVSLSVLFLLGLVVQTVIYFVCKSYHHENIDKSSLSDHLEVYLGEYLPLKATDIQMDQI